MTYVIVGFKVRQEKSVHYAKAKTNVDCLKEVARAFAKGAEFIILRCIPDIERFDPTENIDE